MMMRNITKSIFMMHISFEISKGRLNAMNKSKKKDSVGSSFIIFVLLRIIKYVLRTHIYKKHKFISSL
jgi:hypothetical protein